MSPDGIDPQEAVYGDDYKPKKRKVADDTIQERLEIESLVNQLFATSSTDEQLKLRLVKNIQALLASSNKAARIEGEIKTVLIFLDMAKTFNSPVLQKASSAPSIPDYFIKQMEHRLSKLQAESEGDDEI